MFWILQLRHVLGPYEVYDILLPSADQVLENGFVGKFFFIYLNEVFEFISSEVLDSELSASGGLELDVMLFHVSDERHPAFFVFFRLFFEILV